MTPPRSEGFVRMPNAEFEAILTRAAEEGAKRALADVGLDGDEAALDPAPMYDAPYYLGSKKLEGKVALITGGDSGIGRSVAVLFAREGADVAVADINPGTGAETVRETDET